MFSTIFSKGHNFCDFLFAFLGKNVIYGTLKGKNSLIEEYLTLKEPSEIAADNTSIFIYFYLSKKIRLMFYVKYQV